VRLSLKKNSSSLGIKKSQRYELIFEDSIRKPAAKLLSKDLNGTVINYRQNKKKELDKTSFGHSSILVNIIRVLPPGGRIISCPWRVYPRGCARGLLYSVDRRAGNFACGSRALDIDSGRSSLLEYSRTLVVFRSAKRWFVVRHRRHRAGSMTAKIDRSDRRSSSSTAIIIHYRFIPHE